MHDQKSAGNLTFVYHRINYTSHSEHTTDNSAQLGQKMKKGLADFSDDNFDWGNVVEEEDTGETTRGDAVETTDVLSYAG
jgi:hypothetical protein